MLGLVSSIFLAYFAWEDHKTGETETRVLFPLFVIGVFFVLAFGSIEQSLIVGCLFLMVMLILQWANITFEGDTVVVPMVLFIFPSMLAGLIGLTIGFILSALQFRKKRIPFLPMFFIGWLLGLLTVFVLGL